MIQKLKDIFRITQKKIDLQREFFKAWFWFWAAMNALGLFYLMVVQATQL